MHPHISVMLCGERGMPIFQISEWVESTTFLASPFTQFQAISFFFGWVGHVKIES